jgi:hypothetical protein
MRGLKLAVVVLSVLGGYTAGAYANCPAGFEDEIFCDDFDTYCTQSDTGHPGGSKCPTDGSATRADQRLKEVWLREPRDEDATEILAADNDKFLTSLPYGGNYPCTGESRLGTMTIRDWEHSPLPLSADGQIRNLAWKIQDTFGAGFDAVSGTDEKPLILQFMLDGGVAGKIEWDNGYVEVSLGSDRANTDYIEHADCATYCNPPITQGPFPIICAQGNPTGPLPSGCPNVGTYPPPIRAALAVGSLGMMDYNPCHCGTVAHGGANNHLNVFDGQRWWMLRSNTPMPSTGIIEPRTASDPMPPPDGAKLTTPGDFTLNGAVNGGKSFNWITLTIKSTTFSVRLRTQERSAVAVAGSYPQYYVTSVMENIPRAYLYTGPGPNDFTGAFDALRIGVGQGCQLAGNDSWTNCAGARNPLRSRANNAGALVFDDLYFHGGIGFSRLGACCLPDGTCADNVSSIDCVAQGGEYAGPSSVCGDGSICLGACCKGEAAGCSDTKSVDCPAPFVFKGLGTQCATTSCPCSVPFADADLDGDVDQLDFAVFQACFSGPGPLALSATCKCFDRDNNGAGDQDVDMDDLAKFEACASGPGVALKPTCN